MQIRSGKSTSYSTSRVRPNTKKTTEPRRIKALVIYSLAGIAVAVLLAAGLLLTGGDPPSGPASGQTATAESATAPVTQTITIKPTPTHPPAPNKIDTSWEGPVLYHSPQSAPFHLILVEKAIQQLHLYRYNGRYQLIKTYSCATGENQGKKRVENDEKTPEGIYFNTKSYRDRQVTVFGDRAFELNYPNAFDDIAGNGGDGIYIHGSNRKVTPYSTNGCVALDNPDLEDLDKRIEFDKTPVIIGERLPYTFSGAKRDVSKLVELFRQAMVPKKYAGNKIDFPGITILHYQDKLVSFGTLKITATPAIEAVSRLYLAEPETGLMVMVKREWQAKKPVPVIAKKTAAPATSKQKESIATLVKSWKTAWEEKRLSAYIAHYHPGFVGNGKNLQEWKRHKNRLNKKYKRISVTVSGLKTNTTGNTSRAWFKQRYRSDAFRSNGYKVLEFKKKGNGWKIFREESFKSKPKGWPA
ncbi:MAG: L,D-transpeptidase family protein [Desulfobacterales bacterium]|nr:L,D-transpeptidase family protein [Desulfobacterales bacterium]